MMRLPQIFHVYIDLTRDGRVFYVGKGTDHRVQSTKRNRYWGFIAKKHGQVRQVLMSTRDEKYALELEVSLIYEYKTFEAAWPDGSGWGANLTAGGEGTTGYRHTAESRANMRRHYSKEKHPFYGKPVSEARRRSISNSLKGRFKGIQSPFYGIPRSQETIHRIKESKARNPYKPSQEQREQMSIRMFGSGNPFYGKQHSQDTKMLISRKLTGLMVGEKSPTYGMRHTVEAKKKMSLARQGTKTYNAKITDEKVLEILDLLSVGSMQQKDIAKLYGIDRSTVSKIRSGKVWKHITVGKRQ